MKTFTINLPDEVAHVLEIRAMGVDNIPVEQGISEFLTHCVLTYLENKGE